MTFLLDQDVPDAVARVLRQSGHEVKLLRDHLPMESTDAAVLRHAFANHLVLITCNRDDFLSLAKQTPHEGIIILIRRLSRTAECANLLRLLEQAGESGIRHNLNFA
jgi:predicted nuclease of predicted toxin-antitoxin system